MKNYSKSIIGYICGVALFLALWNNLVVAQSNSTGITTWQANQAFINSLITNTISSISCGGDVSCSTSGTTQTFTVNTVLSGKTPLVNPLTGDLSLAGFNLTNVNSITGNQTTSSLSKFNINGIVNPIVSGAVNSTTVVAATTNGTTAVTLGGAGDFLNGQFVVLPAAGPASPLAAPLWCTTLTCGNLLANYPIIQAVAGGSATGTTTYSWCIKTVDKLLGESACGVTKTISTGPSFLGPNQYALLFWAPVANALGYKIMGCKGVSCPMQEIRYIPAATISSELFQGTADFGENLVTPMLVAVGDGATSTFTCPSAACLDVPNNTHLTTGNFTITAGSLTVQAGTAFCLDNGSNAFTNSGSCTNAGSSITYSPGASAAFTVVFASPPATGTPIYASYTPGNSWYNSTSGTNQWLFTTIASGAQTVNIVLTNPASLTGSTQMFHDNSTPIQTALNALAASAPTPVGGVVRLQRGSYQLSKPLTLPSQVILVGDGGGTNYGSSDTVAPGYSFGTNLIWSGPDGLDTISAYDGMRQGVNNLNIDDRNIMGVSGSATSQSMDGIHIDTSSTGGTGNDKFQSDAVSIYGAHHAWVLGGNAVTDNIFPNGDVSELKLNKPHVLDPGTTDPRAIGYEVASTNAGFNSDFDEPSCLLDENICIWNVAGEGLRVMDYQGSCQAGADIAFILWDTGSGGTIMNGEDENTAGTLSFRIGPGQPNALAATYLTENRFNHGIRLDGVGNIISQGNNTGGNTPSFLVNSPGATVNSTFDTTAGGTDLLWTTTKAANASQIVQRTKFLQIGK